MPMRPAIKDQFVNNLRNGKYPQARGSLITLVEIEAEDGGPKQVTGYCCLGVLSDMAIRSGEIADQIRWQEGSLETEIEVLDPDTGVWEEHHSQDLPLCVARWAGITDKRPDDPTDPVDRRVVRQPNNPRFGAKRAIDLNDTDMLSFPEIADRIEADPLV